MDDGDRTHLLSKGIGSPLLLQNWDKDDVKEDHGTRSSLILTLIFEIITFIATMFDYSQP